MSFATPAASPMPDAGDAKGLVLGPDDGDAYWWLGSLTIRKLSGDRSRGGLDIVDHRVPSGYAPPPHVHSDQDEVFYIIDGRFTVSCGTQRWQAGPGCLVFLPRGVPHGFTVSDEAPGRTLLINAPAGFGEVISELGESASRLELPGPDVPMPDPSRIRAVSEAHGIKNA